MQSAPLDIPTDPLNDEAPEWDLIEEEVACPRCDYNLRGLGRPRCPECGLVFTWKAVFQAARDLREWLFEHQWKRRPIRSLVRTVVRSTRPVKFWRSIALTDSPNRAALRITAAGLVLWVSACPLIGGVGVWVIMLGLHSVLGPAGGRGPVAGKILGDIVHPLRGCAKISPCFQVGSDTSV